MFIKKPPLHWRPILEEILKRLIFACLMSGLAVNQTGAQENKTRRQLAPESASSSEEQRKLPFQSPKTPVNCEVASRYMDDAIARASQTKESYLIVVIRPGLRETGLKLNSMRLMQVRGYLDYTRFQQHVVSIGERTGGTGRVEVYVEGKLLYIIPLGKNRGLDLQSCNGV